MKFGEMIKENRLKQGKSLRKFCEEHEFDPGNHSRLERGLNSPPQNESIIRKLALAIGLEENSDEWNEFFDAAYIENGNIPEYIKDDEEILEKLPVFFRTVSGNKVPSEKLEKLIEIIRKS